MEKIKQLVSDKKMGLDFSPSSSVFRVWSPSRTDITLAIYDDVYTQNRKLYSMIKNDDGSFEIEINENLEDKFYTYIVEDKEITDPYSFASSANSKRSAIIDLSKTNPEGFLEHEIPYNNKDEAIIAETHLADISILESAGSDYPGLFLGSSQKGTNYNGLSTGVDHFKELGITHVHFLPLTDYLTVNELKPLAEYPDNFNWGYDQELYFNLEGSFATEPNNPYSRIIEFKKLVQSYHENGLSVVLDVVFNHTFRTFDSNFQVLEPYYYYRTSKGDFSNGSGCGNEIASERPMVRKFIVEALKFLATEYKIDGFRFDLMALTDIDTVKIIIKELREINPNILIYGEPWIALTSPLPYDKQVVIGAQRNNEFAIFNPVFRDAIKGDTDGDVRGYLQGEYYFKPKIEEGIAGSIDISGKGSTYATPLESINYFNAHDNLIFHDKLVKSGVENEDIKDITYMGHATILLAQGIPFLVAGNSFMRSKYMNHNSYNTPSSINGIDWSLKEKNYDLFLKVKDLIQLRKNLKIFNMKTEDEILSSISFIDGLKDSIIGYTITKEEKYLILLNYSSKDEIIDFKSIIEGDSITKIFENGFVDKKVSMLELDKFSVNVYKI